MPLTRTEFAVRQYPAGDRVSPDFPIPLGIDFIKVKLPVISWPATNDRVGEVGIELSFDGGQTWRPAVRGAFCGIPATGPDGNPCTECTLSAIGIKQPQNPNRRARVRVRLFVPLTTGLTLEAAEMRLGNV